MNRASAFLGLVLAMLPNLASAEVLFAPTATSSVSNVYYQVYDQNYFNWSIPCESLGADSISKVTMFGQGNVSNGALRMTLNGTWTATNFFTTSYSQQVFTFTPAIDCQNGYFNFGLFEYNWGSYSGIWLQEAARVQGCPLPPAYSALGVSQRSGALDEYRGCPSWIIEGTRSADSSVNVNVTNEVMAYELLFLLALTFVLSAYFVLWIARKLWR